ncbi:hypothetical protein NZK32_13440 [Cyanobium sp. FGCU-52]|nr:hypothetical protein [Cyanobium sp. FGCU52]
MTAHAFRSPRRVSITIPFRTYQDLLQRSNEQGRSLSNLAAYLLETALLQEPGSTGSTQVSQRIGA